MRYGASDAPLIVLIAVWEPEKNVCYQSWVSRTRRALPQ